MDEKLASEINAFVEYYWNRITDAPSIERTAQEFPSVEKKALAKQLGLALDRLQLRGYSVSRSNYLSPEQLALANSLLNLADRRSSKKKLDDLKISPATYANWRKNPVFIDYLRERSEAVLGNGVSEAHLALVDSASSGDIQAIKLLYEITGRHTPGSAQVANIKTMLIRVIEAVQRHVTDPKILQAIAAELQDVTGDSVELSQPAIIPRAVIQAVPEKTPANDPELIAQVAAVKSPPVKEVRII